MKPASRVENLCKKYRIGFYCHREYATLHGVAGLAFLILFYLSTMAKLWPFARRKVLDATEWEVAVARMTIAAFAGFMISAQFVITLPWLARAH